jgi:uncharacterized protein YbaP (TraB family)
MLRTLLALVLILSHSVSATSIWQVTAPDGDTLFIGGTVHVLPASELPLPQQFNNIYANSDELIFESDMAFMESAQFQQLIMQGMVFHDGRTFIDVLKPETVELVNSYLQQRSIPVENFLPMKPSLLGFTITFIELQLLGLTQDGVDKLFFDKATQDNKNIAWLESPQEQLDMMNSMAQGQEDVFVSYSVTETATAKLVLDGMLSAWRSGDMKTMADVGIADMPTEFPRIYDLLLKNRNQRWIPQIETMFTDDNTEFVLVGVLHLAGEHSVLAMLESKGYKVTQLQ